MNLANRDGFVQNAYTGLTGCSLAARGGIRSVAFRQDGPGGSLEADGKGKWWEGMGPQELNGRPHDKNDPCPEFVEDFMLRVQDVIDLVQPGPPVPLPGHGRPDEDEFAFLDKFGAWMAVNSEAIYSTRPWMIAGEGPTKFEGSLYGAQARDLSRRISGSQPRATLCTPSRLPRIPLTTAAKSPASDSLGRNPIWFGRVARKASRSACRKCGLATARTRSRSTLRTPAPGADAEAAVPAISRPVGLA